MTTAKEICETAAALVSGERDRQHGAKEQNFHNISKLWAAYLSLVLGNRLPDARGFDFYATDVANMMALMKMARTFSGEYNPDDYIDMVGYAACAGELASPKEAADAPEV